MNTNLNLRQRCNFPYLAISVVLIFEKRIVTAGTYNTVDDILKALAKATNEADKRTKSS